MSTIEAIREFLGWCSVINIGLLILSSVLIIAIRRPVSRIHAKMFDLNENDVQLAYFQYLGQYKVAIIMFNIVPYLALKIMS
ncbi:DUF6868 family protein [Sulfurovum sp. ST-21]|uniref:DUF6868 domain-containing protein n=1 Tax=Sulfurovum indicum TaxID=2779528 RepID=A0A7M1S3N8_9BACT|nr:hypothetical protein [Sulfurovum indicum]QOR60960.1 hypothetical protein IMZ28_05695 [Sulfurovum indicum]